MPVERLLDRHRRVEDARFAADVKNRLPVVLELPAGCDANDCHGSHSIRDVYAHQIERARELRAHVGHAGGAPPLPIRVFFAQDRIPMVERVERLRQPEGVFGQTRELQRSDDLIRPPRPGAMPRTPPPRGRGSDRRTPRRARRLTPGRAPASTSASETPSRSCSLCRMLRARTTAYCRYGPVSPSKLSASSMSNTISLPRENFSMK